MPIRLLALFSLTLLSFPAFAQRYLEMIEAGTYPITEIQKAAEMHFDSVGRGRGSGYKQFKRWEYVAMQELDASGVKIPNFELATRARNYRRAAKLGQTEFNNFGGEWKQLGPTYSVASSSWSPGLGRVTSIGIDESDFNHLIVGSPTGGVWKSTTGGNSWTPISDEYTSIDVYALEISPYDNKQYLWGSTSGKIYRSLDGGATWNTTSNVTGNGKVSRILYHPTDPNIVYAVSESNGLFRSVNKGNTWTAVAGVSGVVGYDVEFKPGDPNTIYFSGISVYRSTDGGTSFNQISGFGTANNNYKRMGVSPANPNVVYVLEALGGKFGGFYKSTDSGASFSKLVDGATINYLGYSEVGDDDKGQAPRNMDIAIHPLNANEVHIGGIHTWKSVNGGVSFELSSYWVPGTAAALGVGYNHADIDVLKFAGNTLLVGTDGGFFVSTNSAASFEDRSSGLSIKELYKIGVSKTNPNVVTGGSQDNGTCVMRGANRTFVDWLGADGMETFVDWNNASILYGTSQNGSMYRSTNQGTSRSSIAKPLDADGAWVTPFEQDPQVSTTIYVAFADVWKSTNSGNTWTKISTFDNGNMSQMKLAPSNNQRIYVSRGSSLFTTANGGTTWTTTASGWGSSTINYIAVHPQNPQRLLIVTNSGVYHSTNAGANWNSIGAGLPSDTKYCATWENTGKNGIYVGGFGYVSYINDDLSSWVGFFDGLPNARVYELEINYISNTIFAGTYGRGLWESQLYKALAPVAAFTADKHAGCKELTVNFTDQSANSPSAWEWSFEGGSPATSTLQHPTVTFSGSGSHIVRLKASNIAGESVTEAMDTIVLIGPSAPTVANAERCEAGEITLTATGQAGELINWYASPTDLTPLYTGNSFTTNIAQTTSFFVGASINESSLDHVGPLSNDIGGGSNHDGGRYLYLDVETPFRLKSATVYAIGAANRTFQLKDANGNLLLQKIVFIEDGTSRVTFDMDIPQGLGLQLTCISPANLYRNSSGVNYPYTIPGVMQITGSSGGSDYYYYLYDIEVESGSVCESDRVAATAVAHITPEAPTIAASGLTELCPGATVMLSADSLCAGCALHWSNGETGSSILVASEGTYTATAYNTTNNICGDGPSSNAILVAEATLPGAAIIQAAGSTALCTGQSLELSVSNLCPACAVHWSTGESGSGISVAAEGIYTAVLNNFCGDGPVSNEIAVVQNAAPDAPVIEPSGATALCPGESVVLTVSAVCADCTVLWSTGESDPTISVSTGGTYTAILRNVCGDSPASNEISVSIGALPEMPLLGLSGSMVLCPGQSLELNVSNICPACTVQWSTGETGPGILVSTEGTVTATLSNVCGEGPVSDPIVVSTNTIPDAAAIEASGATSLCPGESVLLSASNLCPDCIVTWSNSETGPAILVSSEGLYTATLSNICGESPASNAIPVTVGFVPEAPILTAQGNTVLCPGESVVLHAENVCADCVVHWSNGETGPSITVSTGGIFTATLSNDCGESLASAAIQVVVESLPPTPIIGPSGTLALCPGESVELMVLNDVCFTCTVNWSNGATGHSIIVSSAGVYTATTNNGGVCGDSPVSNAILVTVFPPFEPVVSVDNLCHLTAPAGTNYQWLVDGVEIPGATGPSWSAQVAGLYTVSMMDADGCQGLSAPVFAEACISAVQNPAIDLKAHVYPNPAEDRISLDIQSETAVHIHFDLYAIDGRYLGTLYEGDVLPGKQQLDLVLPELPDGMYQYRLITELGNLNGNLVVQRR